MKSEENRGSPRLTEATDGHLFALMARRDEDGKNACAEFYQRYINDFHNLVCRRIDLSDAEADDLVQETIFQAYQSASTYECPENLTTHESRALTLAWLGRIAQRLHYSEYRKKRVTLVTGLEGHDGDEFSSPTTSGERKVVNTDLHNRIREAEDSVARISSSEDGSISPERQLLRDALSSLKERERDILLVYRDHQQPGEKHPHLPKEILAQLCERHQIKPAHARKIRERAYKQVLAYVQANKTGQIKS
jgi:RNA polymerase sigma factor (sigma-70 family)